MRSRELLLLTLVGTGAAVPLVCIAVDLLFPTPTKMIGRDFAAFWAAGHLIAAGHPNLAYSQQAITGVLAGLAHQINEPFIYPPPTLALLAPFGMLSYFAALVLWTIVGATVFAWAARRPTRLPVWLVLLTPAALLNIWDGQFGFFFGALWLLSFEVDQRRAGIAAAFAGALKPHLALLLAPSLLKRPAVLATAAAVGIVLVAVSLPLLRPFMAATQAHATWFSSAWSGAFFHRMMPGAYAAYGQNWWMQLLFAAAAIAVLVRYRATDPFTLATAAFLIVPYAYNYDMTVANIGFAVPLWRRWGDLDIPTRSVLALGYLSPPMTFIAPWAVPPTLFACLCIQASLQQQSRYYPSHSPDSDEARSQRNKAELLPHSSS